VMAADGALEGAISSHDESLLRAVRARGGSLLAEGLEVEPAMRAAVAAALGEVARALAVDAGSILGLRDRSGLLVLAGEAEAAPADERRATALMAAVSEVGGGPLMAAIRRDPAGHVSRLLRRCAWVPDLAAALRLRPALPAGWRLVTPAGEMVSDDGIVRLGGGESLLDQRAARDEQAGLLTTLEHELEQRRAKVEALAGEQVAAAEASIAARRSLDEARRSRRLAEEAERTAQRRSDQLLREVAWQQSLVERLEGEVTLAESSLASLEAAPGRTDAGASAGTAEAGREQLRSRRDELARRRAAEESRLRAADDETRRAEVALSVAESRTAELDEQAQALASREAEIGARLEEVGRELAAAAERELRQAARLDEILAVGSTDRGALIAAERAAIAARERLRGAEGRSRGAEVALMEARLQLDQVRESLLVELAGIGGDGLAALRAAAGQPALGQPGGETQSGPLGEQTEEQTDERAADTMADELEATLDVAAAGWTAAPPPPSPATTRVGLLRRRFHELGAGNPFATEEYEQVRLRLESLEGQRADLETAIAGTRELIADLSALINEQFRATFSALEGAFARRFEQLFGGGEAQLSLTAPEDLATTGIEITARPPGKKRQPLGMLSGGERALTAVCLLLAMLEVRPVPFCVLDEVDAALDEANISRFSTALRSLADQIQFVVITHNRGTIEAADALYGVTIGDDAVSRIVSLRLPSPADGNGHATEDQLAEHASEVATTEKATDP
ncbi:MAG TPA: hypothetical protein VNW68_02170, partial [Candidatus Limnocylindria bacterium]|nr:hypothetical protein [Candidatus Limnocylindria bacterium]